MPPADPLMGEVRGLLTNAAALETRGVQAMDDTRLAGRGGDASTGGRTSRRTTRFTRLNLGTSLY